MEKDDIIIELRRLKQNFVDKARSIGAEITMENFAARHADSEHEKQMQSLLASRNEGSRETYLAIAMKVQLILDKIA